MTDLSDLQRKIFQRASSPPHTEETLAKVRLPQADTGWQKDKPPSFFRKNIWLFIVAFFIIAGGLLVFMFGRGGFSEANVQVTLKVPKEISGVSIVQWQLQVKNNNSTELTDVVLAFEYPEHALALEDPDVKGRITQQAIGTIGPGQDVQRVFHARLFGAQEDIKKTRALLSYKTPGISRTFNRELFSEVKIVSSPVSLVLQGPERMEANTTGVWNIHVSNDSDFDFSGLRLRVEYPQSFSFVQATPEAGGNKDTWDIASLKIGQERTIEFLGSVSGAIGDEAIVTAYVEYPVEPNRYITLARKIATTKLSISALSLVITANDKEKFVGHAGETITIGVKYRNNVDQPINDVFIEGNFVSDVVDATTVQTRGTFDPSAMKVRWDFTNTLELKEVTPGDEGIVEVIFTVKKKLPVASSADKNFTIRFVVTASSDSPTTTLPASRIKKTEEFVIPISTSMELQIAGEYRGGPFTNTGGIPPTVGKQTTYTVYWRLKNLSNDVNDVEVVTTLPSWVTFTGMKKANFEAQNLYYDSAKRQVIWNIDKLPGTTGVALPTYEAIFQVGVNPEKEHVGKIIDVIGSTNIRGIDSFTSEVFNMLLPPMKTDLNGHHTKGISVVVDE